jgi:hypothetical protein
VKVFTSSPLAGCSLCRTECKFKQVITTRRKRRRKRKRYRSAESQKTSCALRKKLMMISMDMTFFVATKGKDAVFIQYEP